MKVSTSSPQAKGEALQFRATASSEETSRALDAAYRQVGATLGLAPSECDRCHVEEAAKRLMGMTDLSSLITPRVLEQLVPLAIDEKNARPAFVPHARAEGQPKAGKPFSFTFELTPKPAYTLSAFEDMRVTVELPAITEEDVDAEILYIAQNYLAHGGEENAPAENETVSIDDAWVAENAPWFKDYENLRAVVRKNLEEVHEASLPNRMRQATAKELAKHLQGSIENDAYTQMAENLRQGFMQQLKAQGLDYASVIEEEGGEENLRMAFLMQARDILTQGYALDALFARERLTLTQADIDAACLNMNPGQPAQETYAQAKAMGRMHVLMETAERLRANDWLVEHATVEMLRPDAEGAGAGAQSDPAEEAV